MSSVISDIICPRCKWEHAICDISTHADSDYITCRRCGYFAHVEEGKKKVERNLGAMAVYFNGGGTLGGYAKQSDIDKFKADFEKGMKNRNGDFATFVYYTFYDWKEKKWLANILSQNRTIPFEEVDEAQRLSEKEEMK